MPGAEIGCEINDPSRLILEMFDFLMQAKKTKTQISIYRERQ